MSDVLPANRLGVPTSIGDHLQRIDGCLIGIESRLAAVEERVTELRVAVASLKGRVDALPTTLQVCGIGCGLLVGLLVLATIGVFVARTMGVIA